MSADTGPAMGSRVAPRKSLLFALAAALWLQALPASYVQRVTAALSALDAPTTERLAEAERLLLAELELGEMHPSSGIPEAA